MKRIFALVLAVLTVLGLSSAAFAATVYTTPDLSGLLKGAYDGSSIYYNGGIYGLGGLLGFTDTEGNYRSYNDLYTSWYDACPKETCDGVALFYVDSGSVKWFCPKCGSTGVAISGGSSSSGSGSGSGTIHTALVCTICGKSDKLKFKSYGIVDGKYSEIYECTRCDRQYAVEVKDISKSDTDYYGFKKEMNCLSSGCKKTAALQGYVVKGDRLYARYKCTADHEFDIEVNDTYYSGGAFYRSYSVQVVSATGGSYSLDSSTAHYGDTRTVTFYPSTGYSLSRVTVNGVEAYVKDNKVSFTVTGDTVVRPTFVQTYTTRDYTITAKTNGNGTVGASKNNYSLKSATPVTAKYTDKVVYTFYPASRDYRVSDVKIDGKSQGAVSSYTFNGVTADHTVEVTFSWANPYCDVETKYLSAVEYVTEAGLMGKYNTVSGKTYFSGRTGITVGDLVYALTELSDTAGRLNSDLDRVAWAINYGIISKNTDLNASCDVREACTLIKLYLEVLEDLNKVTFTKLDRRGTVRDNAISLNLATGKTYDGNRNLHRYDLASICRLIARLDYKG